MSDGKTDMLSVSEAAIAWGKSERTVFRWIESGRIESIRRGRNTFVPNKQPEPATVTVVTNRDTSDMRQPMSVTGENVAIQRLLADVVARQPRATTAPFSWVLLAVTIFVVVSVSGLATYFGRDYIRRTDLQLMTLSATVSIERTRADRLQSRATEVQAERDKLADEIGAMLRQQAAAKKAEARPSFWGWFL